MHVAYPRTHLCSLGVLARCIRFESRHLTKLVIDRSLAHTLHRESGGEGGAAAGATRGQARAKTAGAKNGHKITQDMQARRDKHASPSQHSDITDR